MKLFQARVANNMINPRNHEVGSRHVKMINLSLGCEESTTDHTPTTEVALWLPQKYYRRNDN